MLFSVSHQQESATGIPMSPPSQTPSHLSPHPTLLRLLQSPCLNSQSHAANSHWLSILHYCQDFQRESIPRQGS